MKTKLVKVYVCRYCERESGDINVIKRCEKACLVKEQCNHKNIEYQDIYEMRSEFMYCKDCGKKGSRRELNESGR